MIKKIRVQLIVVLVALAMIALLIIQAFQTRQLYDRKAGQFSNEVQTTLERVAVRHEKAEDVRRFFKVANTNFSGQYKDILKEEFQNLLKVQESISIRDTTIYEDGEPHNYFIVQGMSYDSLTGVSAEQRVLARDVRQLRELYQNSGINDSLDIAIQLDQKVIKKMFEKAKYVNEMMIQAFRENVYDAPEHRFDVAFLDSVLRTEFADDQLPSDFQFVVLDDQGKTVPSKHAIDNYQPSLKLDETYQAGLFPSNVFGDNFTLHVYFPSQKSFLLREMWGPLTVNLTLVILIAGALIFMFRTILTQRKLAELKNDFISNMTHEFKTPISTISLACQAMEDPDMGLPSDSMVKPYVKMIGDENVRLSKLVERILQSATLDKGDVQLNLETVLLNELIEDLVVGAKFRTSKEGGEIAMHLPTELITVHADRMHLTNVISNLIDNGIKYSQEAPHIEVTLEKQGAHVRIHVKDHGIGIKKEHISKIFDKLYRIPTGNVHNVKGFGLGLSYVKALCEMHGWNILVQSKYGEGSTFTIDIKQ